MEDGDIKNFIKNEKDISKYRLSILKKNKRKSYNRQAISLERSFIDFPFEDMPFKDIDEARAAIELFRTSKVQFSSMFPNFSGEGLFNRESSREWSEDRVSDLRSKELFLEYLYLWLLDVKIREVNAVQDSMLFEELSKKIGRSELLDMNISDILKIEGAYFLKKRARMQSSIYSMGRFVYGELKSYRSLYGDLNKQNHNDAERFIDSVIDRLSGQCFRYFNQGLDEIHLLVKGTMGENFGAPSVNRLQNLFEKFKGEEFFVKRVLPTERDIYNLKTLTTIKRKAAARAYALVTPMSRVGNEYTEVMFREVWSDCGCNIDKIIGSKFFNTKSLDTEVYYKALECVSPNLIIDEALGSGEISNVAKLITGIKTGLSLTRSEAFIMSNNSPGESVRIDASKSKVLIPETRSDSLHLLGVSVWCSDIVKKINYEYYHTNKVITNDISNRIESRKNLIKELFDN